MKRVTLNKEYQSLLLSICKKILHLVTFAGYFADINDILLYIVGYLIGWYLELEIHKKVIS